jgi:hypothetical protein
MTDKTVEVGGHESVLKDMTEDQLAELRTQATELSMAPEINLPLTVGIAACRLYVVARMGIRNELADKGYEWKDGFEEMFLRVVEEQAHEPFAMEELMEQLRAHVLIFMEDQIGSTDNEKDIEDGNDDVEDGED